MSKIKLTTIIDLLKSEDACENGIELLYKHYGNLLFSAALCVCPNQEDCKDIVQNVLIKLSQLDKSKFPSKGESSWLYRVVKNEAINYSKKQKQSIDIDTVPEIPDVNASMDDVFDMDNYYELIESLDENQKEVVTLKVLGGFSHKEISNSLGKPIGTIQWIYNTSIKKLRIALATMASMFIALVCGATYRGFNLPSPDGEVFTTSDFEPPVTPSIFEDPIFISLAVAALIILAGTIIFYYFNDKLPTKRHR